MSIHIFLLVLHCFGSLCTWGLILGEWMLPFNGAICSLGMGVRSIIYIVREFHQKLFNRRCTYLFIHSLNNYLLTAYSVPNSWDTLMIQTVLVSAPGKLHSNWGDLFFKVKKKWLQMKIGVLREINSRVQRKYVRNKGTPLTNKDLSTCMQLC